MRSRVDRQVAGSLPLYAGSYLAAAAGLAAVTMTVDAPAFTLFIHTLLLLGYGLSLWGRLTDRDVRPVGALVLGLAFVEFAFARVQLPVPGAELFFPQDLTVEDLPAAGLVAWLTVALGFAAYSRGSLLWSIVSSLAIFGLVGTINLNSALAVDFFLFLFAAVFTVGYENLLAQEEVAGGPAPGWAAMKTRARNLLAHTSLTFLFVGLVALAGGAALHRIIPRPYAAAFQQRLQQLSRNAQDDYTTLRREFRLGRGPIRLGEAPVFEARGATAPLWRVHAYDRYGDNTWRQTVSDYGSRARSTSGYFILLPFGHIPERPAVQMQRRTAEITPVQDLPGPLPFPAQPVELRLPAADDWPYLSRAGRGATVDVDSYGCVIARHGVPAGVTYRATYEFPVTTAEALRAAPPVTWRAFEDLTGSKERAEDLLARYTQIPNDAWEIHRLAEEAVGNQRSAYDRVVAIQKYLYDNCRYTLDAPATPRRRDAVLHFLRSSRQGACDLFASAFTLLARAEGIPARVVTGFAKGSWSDERQCVVVTERDLHAWAEVYFTGLGWVAIDPPSRPAGPEEGVLELLRTGRVLAALTQVVKRWLIWVLLAIAVLWTLAAVLETSAIRRWWAQRWRTEGRSNRARIARIYQRTCDVLGRKGLGREPWQTPGEHLSSVRQAGGWLATAVGPHLEALVGVFRRAKYGPEGAAEQELLEGRRRAEEIGKLVRKSRQRRK